MQPSQVIPSTVNVTVCGFGTAGSLAARHDAMVAAPTTHKNVRRDRCVIASPSATEYPNLPAAPAFRYSDRT
jgi:hypothetical protein